jgi:hypothetical protein
LHITKYPLPTEPHQRVTIIYNSLYARFHLYFPIRSGLRDVTGQQYLTIIPITIQM